MESTNIKRKSAGKAYITKRNMRWWKAPKPTYRVPRPRRNQKNTGTKPKATNVGLLKMPAMTVVATAKQCLVMYSGRDARILNNFVRSTTDSVSSHLVSSSFRLSIT